MPASPMLLRTPSQAESRQGAYGERISRAGDREHETDSPSGPHKVPPSIKVAGMPPVSDQARAQRSSATARDALRSSRDVSRELPPSMARRRAFHFGEPAVRRAPRNHEGHSGIRHMLLRTVSDGGRYSERAGLRQDRFAP